MAAGARNPFADDDDPSMADAVDAESALDGTFMGRYDRDSRRVENAVRTIVGCTASFNSLADEMERAISKRDRDALSQRVQSTIRESTKAIQEGKAVLGEMQQYGESLSADRSGREKRLVSTKHQALTSRLVEAAKECQTAKVACKEVSKAKLIRAAQMVPELRAMGEDDLSAAVEQEPELVDRHIQAHVQANDLALHELQEAQSTYSDTLKLYRSVQMVHQMVEDLEFLVLQQGEMIDSIVDSLDTARVSVQKGNEAIQRGIKHQKRARKCWICVACILIIVLLIICGALGAFLGAA